MQTLCYGGSFNPIHVGHLQCAAAVARSQGFGQVLLIPAAIPPHKPGQTDLASFSDRLKMCELATEGDSLFAVSDIEGQRPELSYTIVTARALRQRGFPDVHWLIGADQLRDLPTWHQARQLIAEIDIVVMARPGFTFDWDSLPAPFQRLRGNLVDAPLVDVSSTEIRRRVKAGEPIERLVAPAVAEYIERAKLYR